MFTPTPSPSAPRTLVATDTVLGGLRIYLPVSVGVHKKATQLAAGWLNMDGDEANYFAEAKSG